MASLFVRPLLAACSPSGARAPLSILIFHRVLAAPDPLFPGEIDVQRFDEILAWLHDWLNVLPLAEAVERLQSSSLPRRAACITFDDGYADNFTNALPLLRKHGLHSTFFISTGFLDGGRMWNDTLIESVRSTQQESIELGALGLGMLATRSVEEKRRAIDKIIPALKHREPQARDAAVAAVAERCAAALPDDLMLTSAQLRDLRAAGMGIGAHTVSHPILARCDEATARREIADSRAHLESLLGERIGLFAYPNGKLTDDYTPAHATMVTELGFDAAVSTNAGVSRRGDDPYQLRRFTPWDTPRWRFGLRLAQNLFAA
jgi:peptidoglycan/xylan/chitin deacetylase (PgdA/CDA1 family)